MAAILKKTGRFFVRGGLSILALFVIALIALQILLVVGINAVNTGRGTGFILEKANSAMQDSGYNVSFTSLTYDPVQGVSLRDFSVSDREGPFLHIDKFSVRASLAMVPLRMLDVAVRGNVMTLSRLPAAQEDIETADKDALQPFTTPDLYFHKISVSPLSFEKVVLEEAVLGQPYVLSPFVRADISLGRDIRFDLDFKPGMAMLAETIEAPENLVLTGSFAPKSLDLAVETFVASAKSYDLSAQGTANIGKNGIIDVSAKAEHRDLAAITQHALQSMSASLSAKGALSAPAIDLAAKIVTKNLKERGLSDISVEVTTDNIQDGLQGQAKIETAFQEMPVTLEAALSYAAPELSVREIKGRAPDITVGGDIVFSTETALIDGTLTLTGSNLARYKDLAGIDLAGKINAKSVFKPADGEQAADIDVSGSDIVLQTYKIKKVDAQASLASLANPWPQSAKVNATGVQITNDITLDTLNAAIAQGDGITYKLSVNGKGSMPSPVSFDGTTNLSDLTQAVPVFENIALNLRLGNSSAAIKGGFSTEQVNLSVAAKDFRGADIPASLPEQLKGMRIDLSGTVTGDTAQPKTDISATLRGVGSGAYETATIDLNFAHDGTKATVDVSGKGQGIRKLSIVASAPLTWGILPFQFTLDQDAPLQGTLAADLDLGAISRLFLPPTQSLAGVVTANGTIDGTIAAPDPKASLRLSSARFEDSASGILIDRMNAAAAVTKNSLTLQSLSATDGKDGTISGKGTLYFDSSAANLSLQARNFNAPRSELANGFLNADLALKGTGQKLNLSGSADILEMNIMIPEKFSSNIPQLNIVEEEKEQKPGMLDALTLDVTVQANNQIFVRGWGLDAEFGGKIAVTGTASTPQFNGAFTSRRGRFEEFGKRFKLERANLQFQGSIPPSPYLDIEATTPAGDVTGSILLTGSAQSPSIKFASTPSLPEDEVLSRILFGKDSTKISPFQAVQLAQTIRRFSGEGGGGFDPLDAIRSATGLDDISVDTDETGGASVGAGKYLTDNVYLEFSKGKAENSGAATIQIEVTPSINVESEIGQDAQGGGGIFWKHDY